MLKSLFNGIFDTEFTKVISVGDFILCIAVSLVLGLILALTYMRKTRFTKSFLVTLATLPTIVCVVIMMVNGNIGAGVAVAGAFSLVRFRSVPGTAKEIGSLFMAMCTGLIAGMGYLAFSALFTFILCGVYLIYSHVNFGTKHNSARYKSISITVPEDLDYTGVFEDLLEEYTTTYEQTCVKTIGMGSMFRITYDVILKDPKKEKELIDELRCRNGNLEIMISHQSTVNSEL